MTLPVTIENDSLRIQVYPQFGGKVHSIVDKSDNYDLLFDYPAEFPTVCRYDQPYANGYCAGWDECFPAIGPGPYPKHPYKGISIPDHGELWSLPTGTLPTKDGITTEWQGLRFGYRLSRKLWLDGPALHAEYTLTNLAPFDLHFVWAMHALFSLHVPVKLELPEGSYRLSHDAEGRRIDAPFAWPVTAAGEDLSQPAELPVKRGWKLFSSEPVASPAVVRYPSRRRWLKLQFASEHGLHAYWGMWINSGGWAGHKHFAIEPTTGRFDELDRAVNDGSAGCVAALSKTVWRVQCTVGAEAVAD